MALKLVSDDDRDNIEFVLGEIETLTDEVKWKTQRINELKAHLGGVMAFNSTKRLERSSSLKAGKNFRATFTVPKRTTVDAEGIEKALGARRFAKISHRVLDSDKLLDAVDAGRIDRDLVSKYITVTEGAPSVRFYTVDEKEEDDEGPGED